MINKYELPKIYVDPEAKIPESWKYDFSNKDSKIDKFKEWCVKNKKTPTFEYANISEKKRANVDDKAIISFLIRSSCQVSFFTKKI